MLSLAATPAFSPPIEKPVPDFGPNWVPSTADNMNGAYPISMTPGGKAGLFPKRYADYPGGVEYFDAYSPAMSTLYSQVWWKPLAPTALPDEIVKKYNGTGMAIVGWEIDQVRRTPEGDVSVPITATYNHHYVSQMIGAGKKFTKVKLTGPDDPRAAKLTGASHGRLPWEQEQYVVEDVEGARQSALPSHQQFSSANGGEYRKTYHGFAPGYALVVDSPTAFQVSPMQIDTWNRDEMDISGPLPPKFVPGPLPRSSHAPPGAGYSGLLECPMTTRVTKKMAGVSYAALQSGACAAPILTLQECFQAAADTLPAPAAPRTNTSGPDPTRPSGCSAAGASVFFNTLSTGVACAAGALCVCPIDPKPFGEGVGLLVYHRTNQSADLGGGTSDFGDYKRCAPWPATELLNQTNPTCDLRHYTGGQWSCLHGWSLLDAEQEIPWADQPLVFHHKYRFWVQPYDAAYHTPLTLGETVGSALLLGSPWEYDVPQCAEGVPGCSRGADGSWVHTVTGKHVGRHTFAALNFHCHAPTCLAMEAYACEKGVPLEACDAANGRLVCRTAPVYGGSGAPALNGSKFDEAGYIAIPDCMWGAEQFGLEPPADLDGVPLHLVKTCNATYAHYGEMAGGQPWVLSSS